MTKIRRKRGTVARRRRRRQRRERVILLAISSACCLAVLYLLGLITGWRGGTTNDHPGLQLAARLAARKRLGGPKGNARRRAGDGLLQMRKALEDPGADPAATEQARGILAASANLVNIEVGSHAAISDDAYRGVVAKFCALDFSAQKENPAKAADCDDENYLMRVDLNEAVALVREFDADNADNSPAILDLRGAVFHESRCGSTLAANSMLALNPAKHRVYSESSPPIAAMKVCGEDYSECSVEAAANLLKDPKSGLFFKFQSITTRTMDSFRSAFPTTPWLFLYREPTEVLMSQLDVPPGVKKSKANCVRAKHSAPVEAYIENSDYEYEDLIDEEFCAIHLATLCESALRNLDESDGLGMALQYHPDLVHDFLDTVFPKHFHTPVDPAGRDRVLQISGTYSKNRGRHAEGEFKPDSAEKERRATRKMKAAAKDFLRPSFVKLQRNEHNLRPSDEDDEEEEEEE
ncbi:hypothetical protein ACHAXT_006424 [Thalassiosira profunda]